MGAKDCCNRRVEAATISGICIYLVREICLLSGKSQGILKTDVCGNHGTEVTVHYCSCMAG